MTAGFNFAASCPRCGGELLSGEPGTCHDPDRTWLDARCDVCLDLYRITVTATVVEPWPVDRLASEARRRDGAAYAVAPVEGMLR